MSQTAAALTATARTPRQARPALTIALFATYVVVLVGVILFKFPFSYQLTGSGRVLNLIPLKGSIERDGMLAYGQIVDNVLIFVPLGIYLCALKPSWSFTTKTLTIIGTTVAFETIQYVFAIGRADITDVLANTLGGLVGIGIYALLSKALGNRTNEVMNIAGVVVSVCALLFFALLWIRSMSV
jgi:glycopeptide antibiotics resistance protein